MKIDLTYGKLEIILGNEDFKKAMGKELPIRVGFHLSRILKKIQPDMEVFQEKKREVINKYAITNDDGSLLNNNGMIQFTSQEAIDKINELNKEQLNIDEDKIKANISQCPALSPSEIMVLMEFVDFEDIEEK